MVVIKSATLPIPDGPNAGQRVNWWLHRYDGTEDSHIWTRDPSQALQFPDMATAHAYWLTYLRRSTHFHHEFVGLERVAA